MKRKIKPRPFSRKEEKALAEAEVCLPPCTDTVSAYTQSPVQGAPAPTPTKGIFDIQVHHNVDSYNGDVHIHTTVSRRF